MKKKSSASDVVAPSAEELQEAMASMQDEGQPGPPIEAEVIKDAPKEEEKKSESKAALVAIGQAGALEYSNHMELSAAAKFAIAAKIAPQHLRKEGPEAVAAAMIFCKQHSLPLSAMGKIMYVRGKVEVFGSLYMALAQKHKDFGEMQVHFLTDKQERICMDKQNLNEPVWACVIKAKKKKDSDWTEFYFTKDEAKTAGLFKNDVYNKYLKDMLYHRAKARMVDAFYASAVEGVEYYEANLEYAEKEVKQSLNDKLGLVPPQEVES